MKAKLLEKRYSYTDTLLEVSGAKVSGIVVILDGKIYRTHGNINVELPDKQRLTFALSQPDGSDITVNTKYSEPYGSSNSVPPGVSAEAIMEEFKQFVISDINS